MNCKKCGKKIPRLSKFCPNCGANISGAIIKEGKKRHSCLKILGIFFFFFVVLPLIIFIFSAALPSKQDSSAIFSASGVFSIGVFLFWAIIKIMKRIKWLNQYFFPRRVISRASFAAAFIILIFYSFWTYNDLNFIHSVRILPLIQDSLAEVAAAKIMGDSIINGRPVAGASYTKVKTSAEIASKRLNALSVPPTLVDYRQSAVDWSEKIAVAAKNPTMWKYLSGELEDFYLALSDGQAKKLFADSVKNIQTLKEFGDTAIKNKNRTAIRYIAAKLLVQEHWLKGIIYSKSNFFALNPFLALNLVPPVLASSHNPLEVPQIGPVTAVPCKKVCSWILEGQRSASDMQHLWFLYRCDWCDKIAEEKQQTGQEEQKQGQQTQTPPAQTQTQVTGLSQSDDKTSLSRGEPYSYANTPPRRKLCFRGVWGQTGAYCAEQVAQMVNEIETSAIDLVEGKLDTQTAWVESWTNMKPLEAGGLTVGEDVLTSKLSPTVQIFYDSCKGKGGIVGGSGAVMVGVPTTESGYRCEYKHNGQSCWGLLTYSGGEYMGGNKGCPEENLIPAAVAEEAAPKTSAPTKTTAPATTEKTAPAPSTESTPAPSTTSNIWDGTYSASCTMKCEDMHCLFLGGCTDRKPDFSQDFNFSFKVQNDIVVTGATASYTISEDGTANNDRIMFPNSSRAYLSYDFSSSGGKAIVSGKLSGGYDEGVAEWNCSCNFSGSRTSN